MGVVGISEQKEKKLKNFIFNTKNHETEGKKQIEIHGNVFVYSALERGFRFKKGSCFSQHFNPLGSSRSVTLCESERFMKDQNPRLDLEDKIMRIPVTVPTNNNLNDCSDPL